LTKKKTISAEKSEALFESIKRLIAEKLTDTINKSFLFPSLSAYLLIIIADITDINNEEE
jgi:hypothetical protein